MGKTKEKEFRTLIDYYQKRLPRHWNFSLIEIPDLKNTKNLSPDLIKINENVLFKNHIDASDFNILLDENGKNLTSRAFANQLNHWMSSSYKKINFIIGGAYGFSDDMHSISNEKLSLSKMTFTHQMVRVFLMEQFYRADQILQGKPYHND